MAFRKIGMTGASGMLGSDLAPYLQAKGYEVAAFDSSQLNLLHSLDDIKRQLALAAPQVLIHSAAFTNVDEAEKNPEMAMSVNKDGTRKIAMACRDLGIIMAYISTDYVFDGEQDAPYLPSDKPNPINAYGLSKYYGELVAQEILDELYVIRTSWLYGVSRHNFVQFVLEAARQGRPLNLVSDWTGSPTWTGSLSHLIEQIVTSGAYGVYHGCDAGAVSKYEQAVGICKVAGLSSEQLKPVSYKTLSFAAKRPHYSVLSPGELHVPQWTTSLNSYLAQYMEVTASAS